LSSTVTGHVPSRTCLGYTKI